MKIRNSYFCLLVLIAFSCSTKKEKIRGKLQFINISRGEITLCGAEAARFGKVDFSLSCAEKVRTNFNLATSLLHSFEYVEAEKIFAKVIDEDPECLMAYWGVAMSNFHPLWTPPSKDELEKGSKIIEVARSLEGGSKRERDYLEAVAMMYDHWDSLNHAQRLLKFESAAEKIYQQYPEDREAAIFYALALRAASNPTDKTFAKQRKAGAILNSLFPGEPNHPGIAHYIIHTYDYPELAEMGLEAARKYAAIAATSAHALHMPSHIFVRLGLWDESVSSNISSMSAAKCYAENSGMQGHWDEELHGMDYLVYGYLQQARDDKAKEQLDYLNSIDVVSPLNNKDAYTFAAVPVRFAIERKKWEEAASLTLKPANFPWADFPWERSLVSFARVLGAAHLHKTDVANTALAELKANHEALVKKGKTYEANQVQIQINASQAWIEFSQGHKDDAIRLMTVAATMEDATEKHPITPGEVLPARELLGDMFLEMKDYAQALDAYESDLKRHPNRFNGLYGAGLAAINLKQKDKANQYFQQLINTAQLSDRKREDLVQAELYLKGFL